MIFASTARDKVTAGVGSIGVVALLGYALAFGLSVPISRLADDAMQVLNLRPPPPPPVVQRPPAPQRKARPMRDAASAANRRAVASPIVAPPAMPPVPSPVVAAPVANIGAAAHNGASERDGPGQGAGGEGDGLGGGGDGDGGDTPPRQIRGRLSYSDLPAALRVEGVERTVAVRYAVNVDGRVSDCAVTESSGSRELDDRSCALIEKRFRFDPSRDGSGRPVRAIVEEEHSWRLDRGDPAPGG